MKSLVPEILLDTHTHGPPLPRILAKPPVRQQSFLSPTLMGEGVVRQFQSTTLSAEMFWPHERFPQDSGWV
jgi:hypothetical protein